MAGTTLTSNNITEKEYHNFKLEENDPDMVKLAAKAFAATIETTKASPPHPDIADIATADSDVLQHHLNSLFTRAKTGSESKKLVEGKVKNFPFVAVFAGVIDLRKLQKTTATATAQEGSPSATPGLGSSVSTDRKTCGGDWPIELSTRWQFYCRCGYCDGPYHRFTFVVATLIDNGVPTLPIKLFGFPHEYGTVKGALLKITLVSDRHIAVYNREYVTTYDPTHQLKMVPHQIGLYEPPEKVKKWHDELAKWGDIGSSRGTPFNCHWGDQPTVHQWLQQEEQPMMDSRILVLSYKQTGTPVDKDNEGEELTRCAVM